MNALRIKNEKYFFLSVKKETITGRPKKLSKKNLNFSRNRLSFKLNLKTREKINTT